MTADDALREEIARALDSEGAFCGDCGGAPSTFYDSGCEGCRRVLHWYADAILPIVARVEQEAYRRGQAEATIGGKR